MTTRLLLVRHGEIDWTGRIGAPSDGLNARGRRQAEAIAARLAEVSPTALYSSILPRAMETAAAISARTGLEVQPEAALREWDPGDWLGLPEDAVRAKHPELWAQMESDNSYVMPGSETAAGLRERATSVVQMIAGRHLDAAVVLVTHGGWLSNFVWHVLGTAPSVQVDRRYHRGWQPFVIDNCSLTVVECGEGKPALKTLNDTSHLDGLAS